MPDKNGENKNNTGSLVKTTFGKDNKSLAKQGLYIDARDNPAYSLKKEPVQKLSEIKSNPNFATPGTRFKATNPGTSNQPISETSGDRAVKSIKKVLGGAITGAVGVGAATMAKGPIYMMYGKKSDIMMSESPLAKYGCSKKYKKR